MATVNWLFFGVVLGVSSLVGAVFMYVWVMRQDEVSETAMLLGSTTVVGGSRSEALAAFHIL